MNQKDSFGKRAGDFFAGKGFYIVLILCVAVIGVSAWAMLTSNSNETDDLDMTLAEDSDVLPTDGLDTLPEEQSTLAEQDGTFVPRDEAAGTAEEEAEEDETTEGEIEEETALTEEAPEEDISEEPTEEQESWVETSGTADELLFIWPVQGEIEVPHSVDELIYDRTMADWRTHSGIDITADMGEKVMAAAAGTVEQIYTDDLYGTTVIIDHGNELRSVYSNLAEVPTVEVGDWVDSGAYIGAVGDTAIVETGIVSHLHLEMIKDGVRVDPTDYLPEQ